MATGTFTVLTGASTLALSAGSLLATNNSAIQANYTNGSIVPVMYVSSQPQQIAGFVPLYTLDSTDCRIANNKSEDILLPVFGSTINHGNNNMNDINNFMVNWPGYTPTYIIQKKGLKWFNPAVTPAQLNKWFNAVVITSGNASDYGIYSPQGTYPGQPNYANFMVDWGRVYHALGPGVYRVMVALITPPPPEVQATTTFDVVIPGWSGGSGNYYVNGLLSVSFPNGNGATYSVSYSGNYNGFLAYLAAEITSSGFVVAVNPGVGLTVTGTNGEKDNGIIITLQTNDNRNYFKATSTNPITGQAFGSGTNVPVMVNNQNGSNYVGFPTVSAQNNNVYNDTTDIFTAAYTDEVIFSGNIVSLAQAQLVTLNQYAIITVKLIHNGAVVQTITTEVTQQNGLSVSTPFTFQALNVLAGDTVQLAVYGSTSYTGTAILPVTLSICAQGSYWQSSGTVTDTQELGTLGGGTAPGTATVTGMSATPPFLLKGWDCDAARGTVKFQSSQSGTKGDPQLQGLLYNLVGITLVDSIRVYGFFGYKSYKNDEIWNEWGPSATNPFGEQNLIRDRAVGKYKYKHYYQPMWTWDRLWVFGFMSQKLLVWDYNYNNSDYEIQGRQVKKAGGCEPKYLDAKQFNKNERNMQRRSMVEIDCEDGIQSVIMSTFGVS